MLHPPGYLIRICIEPKAQGKKTRKKAEKETKARTFAKSIMYKGWVVGGRTTILFFPVTSCRCVVNPGYMATLWEWNYR